MKTLVRDAQGIPLTCCWDDCYRTGYDEIQARGRADDGRVLRYVFCSERHKTYWIFSPHGNGMLPTGERNLWLPVGR